MTRPEVNTFPDGTPMLRVYPSCCTSAYCGKGPESCPTCPRYPEQQEFKRWQEATAAKQTDPIWCPSVYEATRPPEPDR